MDNDNTNLNEISELSEIAKIADIAGAPDTIDESVESFNEVAQKAEDLDGNFNEVDVITDNSEGNFNEVKEDGSISEDIPSSPSTPDPSWIKSPTPEKPKKNNQTLLVIVIALGMVIVGLLIFLIVSLFNKNNENKSTNANNTTNNTVIDVDGNATVYTDDTATDLTPVEKREFNVSVKLGQYKGLEADLEIPPVTDEDIETEMEYFVESCRYQVDITDGRALKEGDTAVIDYVGTLNGEVFDCGSGTDYPLTLGSQTFISGFEEGLVGKKVGDSVSLDLTFPETYYNTDLAGKAVNFMVNITSAYEYVLPELTDELVAANTSFGSIEEYKAAAREEFAQYNAEYADSMMKDDLIMQVFESSEFTGELAEEIAYEEQSAIDYYDYMVQMQYGVDAKTYFSYVYGFTTEEYKTFIHEQAEFQVKYTHVLDEIIKTENLTLTDEEKTGDDDQDLYSLREKAENIIFDNAIVHEK